jgi:hypothetical protein
MAPHSTEIEDRPLYIIPNYFEKAEVIPGKHFTPSINPFALGNGHGRYMTVTPEREVFSIAKWPLHITATAEILKRLTDDLSTSDTAVRRFQK